ncbi:uncharacterized protein LOC135468195 [Liolophura sinensis]|uniref:uncharacterized protein LOC135468195 n=1 Tax=Liolophura sinensis TaxID=3198878 RepID=UPI00315876D9
MEIVYAVVFVIFAATVGTVYSKDVLMDCYECNVHLCSRNQSGVPEKQQRVHEECQKYHEIQAMTNLTARSTAMDELNKMHNTCEPVRRNNCKACIKVDTTVIMRGHHGTSMTSRVISKVCAQEKPEIDDDSCKERGPKYAKSILCVCYGDNCNTASALTFNFVTVIFLLIAKLLSF